MSTDGPVRLDTSGEADELFSSKIGYIAGSKALESLDKIITSTETFFHPSNAGAWTKFLCMFLHRLASEFSKRWFEEQEITCRTPKVIQVFTKLDMHSISKQAQRLTPMIRRAFVSMLRTPALLAMFSKDPAAMMYVHGALQTMAMLEPDLIMPDLLERAYGGLEGLNETHRTTAVLSVLAKIARPLVSESVWSGGQKHLVPLLEGCLPGIDLVRLSSIYIFST